MFQKNKTYIVHFHMNTFVPDYRTSDPIQLNSNEHPYVINALEIAEEFFPKEKHLVRIDRFELYEDVDEDLNDDLL